MSPEALPSLSSLEVAAGAVLGAPQDDRASLLRGTRRGPATDKAGFDQDASCDPREALERAILPGLLRPPCLVSFSGGRDSSAVLAVAATLARREGLPAPIPATNVFAGAPGAEESACQAAVVRHLGLPEWLRVEHTDELDLIGPYAQRVLRAHGLVWPPNVHFHLPLLDAASGGSLLTGAGGDELFTAARPLRWAAVMYGAVRPRPRDVLSVGLAFAPRALRQAVTARRESIEAVWLWPRAQRLVTTMLAAQAAAEPRRLGERMAWWRRLRYLAVGLASLERTAKESNVLMVHPLLSEQLWNAVGTLAMPAGFAGRTEGMRLLFGDLLPTQAIVRSWKAQFDEVFWTERSAAFARDWDGCGAPEEWVDSGALARHWRAQSPSAQTFTLLQSLWLRSAGRPRPAALQASHVATPICAAY